MLRRIYYQSRGRGRTELCCFKRYLAGHSKWANIKHKKARRDADRQKAFIKLLNEIEIAARGGDGDDNFRLTGAIQKAKTNSVPKAKIDAAVERGLRRKGDDGLATVFYEGHAPGGIAILVETCTDNKKRTAPNMRHIFSKYGGNLGDNGSVSWLYEEQVRIGVPSEKHDIETVLDIAVDAGASDVLEEQRLLDDNSISEEENMEHVVVCTPHDFVSVRDALRDMNIEARVEGLRREPTMFVDNVSDEDGESFDNLIDALIDDPEVQVIYHNRAGLDSRISAS
jgi:YebC/PmpR family DNA-binding regulatory protein